MQDDPAPLAFAPEDYDDRLAGLRDLMELRGLDAVVLTSPQNVAYYAGVLRCRFGRPYACVVTQADCVVVRAGLDAGLDAPLDAGPPSHGSVVTYGDGTRDAFWRAVASVVGTGRAVGCEADHLTMVEADRLNHALKLRRGMDIAPGTLAQRMVKSPAEVALIRQGAQVAGIGAAAIRDAIRVGAQEIDVAMAGRLAMEQEIARRFPDAGVPDVRVLFQSGPNTGGVQAATTARKLRPGDALSLTCLPMIHGYGAAMARTLFLGEPDAASRRAWEANLALRQFGLGLPRPGLTCAAVAAALNGERRSRTLPACRGFGDGSCFGILPEDPGRATGLELREDNETALEPGMMIGLEPMLTIPQGHPGAGSYRELDILAITDQGAENITNFPCGPEHGIL